MKINGKYKIGNNKYITLNSDTGEGFEALNKALSSFFRSQIKHYSFPSFSPEDLEQEMKVLALEALPKYNPEKNANLITFLQNHVKNRMINMCKYYAEKCRCANHLETDSKKVRCNVCRSFFVQVIDHSTNIVCEKCGSEGATNSGLWKYYRISVIPDQFRLDDSGNERVPEISEDLVDFTIIGGTEREVSTIKLDLMRFLDSESELNRSIIAFLLQGYSRSEIEQKLGIKDIKINNQITGLIKRFKEFLNEENDGISAN